MKPGIPQGYIEFDTLAHKVLLLLHEHGKMAFADLMEHLTPDYIPRHLSTTLKRLETHGYVFNHGKISKYKSKLQRSQFIWSLKPTSKKIPFRPASNTERMRHHRATKRIKVPSVFQFRGAINVRSE